jgi:hypothetical protein
MSQPQTEAKPNQKPASDVIEHKRIVVLVLSKSTRLHHDDHFIADKGYIIEEGSNSTGAPGYFVSKVEMVQGKRARRRAFYPVGAVAEVLFGE